MGDFFVSVLENESGITRRVIAAVPADKVDYTPDPKSMTALALAYHIAVSEVWFLSSVAKGSYEWTGGSMPESIKTPADVVAWYDANRAPALDKVKATSPDVLAQPVTVFGPPEPNVTYLAMCIRHGVHHRGQLSAYLRPMGGKVPSIYGGSADEPMS